MHKEQAMISAKQYASSFELKVTEGAQHIRASIMHMRSRYKNLPSPLTAEAVIEDQVNCLMYYCSSFAYCSQDQRLLEEIVHVQNAMSSLQLQMLFL